MNDEFAGRVYPLLRHVLGMLDEDGQLVGNRNVNSELHRLKDLLAVFDAPGVDRKDADLAKTALVLWVDEVLQSGNPALGGDPTPCAFERAVFGTESKGWEFFEKSWLARRQDGSEAAEVYLLCAALGMRGVYDGRRSKEPGASEAMARLPANLNEWARYMYKKIGQVRMQPFDPLSAPEPYDPNQDAMPLVADRQTRRAQRWLAGVAGPAVVIIGVWFWFHLA